MKYRSKQNIKSYVRWMPNSIIHFFLLLFLPAYIIIAIFCWKLLSMFKEWIDAFFVWYTD